MEYIHVKGEQIDHALIYIKVREMDSKYQIELANGNIVVDYDEDRELIGFEIVGPFDEAHIPKRIPKPDPRCPLCRYRDELAGPA
jgi:uncharacterized protein YuzE